MEFDRFYTKAQEICEKCFIKIAEIQVFKPDRFLRPVRFIYNNLSILYFRQIVCLTYQPSGKKFQVYKQQRLPIVWTAFAIWSGFTAINLPVVP